MKKMKLITAVMVIAASSLTSFAQPPVLQPGDLVGVVDNYLILIDPVTGVGQYYDAIPNYSTEIEFRDDGILFIEDSDGGTSMYAYDPMTNTPTYLGNHVCCALNGMEFVNDVLYGTNIEGPGIPSTLVTVDQNTLVFTPVGPTTWNQITGLALDPMTGVLYGSAIMDDGQGGGGDSPINTMLVTVDMVTGLATAIGPIGFVVGGLEFDASGTLYASTVLWGPSPGSLLTVDKNTGLGTLVGPTGHPAVRGISFYPSTEEIPINFTIILVIFAVLAAGRVAWKVFKG